MDESLKTNRVRSKEFFTKYLSGKVIDIGAGQDLVIPTAERFDIEDGDANYITQFRKTESYDTVHSSHCLEHMFNPVTALNEWWSLVKPGGYLILVVPDEDLYEQGKWPPTFNLDHKNSFTIYKEESWCQNSINVFDLVKSLGNNVELVRLEQLSSNYRFDIPRYDQTLTPVAECGIEIILRKKFMKQ